MGKSSSASNNDKSPVRKKGTKAKKASPPCAKKGDKVTADVRILIALATKRAHGETEVDRKEIQTLASIPNESSFKVTCGTMKSKGLISYPCGKTLSIEEAGMEKLGPEHTAMIPKTNEEFHEGIMATIKHKKSKEIFQLMSDGRTRSKAEIAKHIGYEENAGSFKTYFFATTKYLDKLEDTLYRMADKNFPFGRRPDE